MVSPLILLLLKITPALAQSCWDSFNYFNDGTSHNFTSSSPVVEGNISCGNDSTIYSNSAEWINITMNVPFYIYRFNLVWKISSMTGFGDYGPELYIDGHLQHQWNPNTFKSCETSNDIIDITLIDSSVARAVSDGEVEIAIKLSVWFNDTITYDSSIQLSYVCLEVFEEDKCFDYFNYGEDKISHNYNTTGLVFGSNNCYGSTTQLVGGCSSKGSVTTTMTIPHSLEYMEVEYRIYYYGVSVRIYFDNTYIEQLGSTHPYFCRTETKDYDIRNFSLNAQNRVIDITLFTTGSGCSSMISIDFICLRYLNYTKSPTALTRSPTPPLPKKSQLGCVIDSRWNIHEWIWLGILIIPSFLVTLGITFLLKNATENKQKLKNNVFGIIFTTFGIASIFSTFAVTHENKNKYHTCSPYFITKKADVISWMSSISPLGHNNQQQMTWYWISSSFMVILYFIAWIIKFFIDDITKGLMEKTCPSEDGVRGVCLLRKCCFCLRCFKCITYKINISQLTCKGIQALVFTIITFSIVAIYEPYWSVGHDGFDTTKKCKCIDRFTNEIVVACITFFMSPLIAAGCAFAAFVLVKCDCNEDSDEQNWCLLLFTCLRFLFILAFIIYAVFMAFLFIVSPFYIIFLKSESIVQDISVFNKDLSKYISLEYSLIIITLSEALIVGILQCIFCSCCKCGNNDDEGTTSTIIELGTL